MFKKGWFQKWGAWVAFVLLTILMVGILILIGFSIYPTLGWLWFTLAMYICLAMMFVSMVWSGGNVKKSLRMSCTFIAVIFIFVVIRLFI